MMVAENSFQFKLPVSVHFGPSALLELANTISVSGKRFLLVTSRDLDVASDKLLRCLNDKKVVIETCYLPSPEPTCNYIDNLAAELLDRSIEGIIGMGGGSVLDLAKALSIRLTHSQPIWSYANLSNRPPLPFEYPLLPVYTIPTTAGTGSEVTPYVVLTNSETGQKGTIQAPEVFPQAAFIDPALTLTMPSMLTATTGLDAFSHAFEAVVNISKVSPFSELFGKEAMVLALDYLPLAIHEPRNLRARSVMSWCSLLAGMAISHRGTTVIHALAEPLGAIAHIPHGQAVAMCMIPVLKASLKKMQGKQGEVLSETNRKLWNSDFIQKVDKLISAVGVTRTVAEYVPQSDIHELSERLLHDVLAYKFRPLKQHPIEFTDKELGDIIYEIIRG